MSAKGSTTTADYIQWDEATALVRKLYKDGNYRMSLLIGVGIFTGLRISDIRKLTWEMLLSEDGEFAITEQKTGKHRTVRVNGEFRKHIEKCFVALKVTDKSEHCFLSQRKSVITTQRVNAVLKEIKMKYKVKCKNISCHSLRKTFGRKVFESSGERAEIAIMQLAELFNHSTPAITKRYLGITQQEILSAYELLDF